MLTSRKKMLEGTSVDWSKTDTHHEDHDGTSDDLETVEILRAVFDPLPYMRNKDTLCDISPTDTDTQSTRVFLDLLDPKETPEEESQRRDTPNV